MFHEKFVTDCHLSVPLQDRWGCTLQVYPSCSTANCAAHAAKVQDWLQSSFIVQDNSAKRPGSGKVRTEHSRKWQPNIQMQNSKLLKLAHYHFLPSLFPEDLGKWFGALMQWKLKFKWVIAWLWRGRKCLPGWFGASLTRWLVCWSVAFFFCNVIAI